MIFLRRCMKLTRSLFTACKDSCYCFTSLLSCTHTRTHYTYDLSFLHRSRRALDDDVLLNPAFTQPSSHLTSFLLTLKTFICESLQDKVIASSQTLFEVLQWTEIDDVYLGDLEWFMGSNEVRGFPQGLLVEEAVATYEYLQAGQQ